MSVQRIELNLYGFENVASVLERVPATALVETYRKDELRLSGQGRYPENAISAYIEGRLAHCYDERLAQLFDALGGEGAVSALLGDIRPRQKWVRYILPVLTSPSNEEGLLTGESINLLHKLGLDLEFWFR